MKNTAVTANGPGRTEPRRIEPAFCGHRGKCIKQILFALLSFIAVSMPLAATAQVQSLVDGNTAFALNLYSELATNDGNLFFSPYSISTCTAMLYAGARGGTELQMADVLGFGTNQQQFASLFGQLQDELEADQQTNAIQLNIANALWTQAGFPFLPAFLGTATNQYQANVNQADFVTNADGVTQAINNWVAQETQDKITNILSPGMINPETRLVLANAIYFLGEWTTEFELTNTSTEPFYLSTTTQVQTPLMHRPATNGVYNYVEGSNFQAIEIPYASNQLSMVILLPSQINGCSQLEQQLSPSFLSNVLAQMTEQSVEVFLPRFTLASTFNLANTLADMGMPDAFTPDVADFSGIDGMEDLYVSFVVHKAWCQVNESGTEAAAATVIGVITSVVGGSTPPPPVFRADHPFIFFIRDTQSGSVLFMGRLANPSQSASVPVPMPQLNLRPSGNSLMISWPFPSTPWTLQQSPDLTGTNWTATPLLSTGLPLNGSPTGNVTNDGTNYFLPITPSAGSLFFRMNRQ